MRRRSRPAAASHSATPNATSCAASGAPDSVNLSSAPGGERVAVVTWSRGARAGIYTFNSGRLTSVERGPDAAPEPKPAKPKKKKTAHG
ncbi:hypothetical protein ACVILK_000248 [Bradyrhizobium embrapense]